MHTVLRLLWVSAFSLFMACAHRTGNELSALSLAGLNDQSAISCQYEKSSEQGGASTDWAFIRQPNRTESRDFLTQQGQIWEKDSKALISMTHLFHQEKVALEYSSGELAATGKLEGWRKNWSVINPDQLKQGFRLEKVEKLGGLEALSYTSPVGDVVWLPSLQLPVLVRTFHEDGSAEFLTLKSCLPLEHAEIKPTTQAQLEQYRRIDFSDLGDMETDPQVRRVEAMLGGHDHGESRH